jgi:ATP adenylyltransferase
MMNYLWAPWRMAYIRGEKKPAAGCIFCHKLLADDAAEHVLARSRYVYVTLNRFPYNNGHLMVVPYEHVDSQEMLAADALMDLMLMVNRSLAALRAAYQPPAFNLGANLGAAAGAGITEHYHFHVVPRWPGDSNFMTAVGHTRVIPASLDETYADLRAAFAR